MVLLGFLSKAIEGYAAFVKFWISKLNAMYVVYNALDWFLLYWMWVPELQTIKRTPCYSVGSGVAGLSVIRLRDSKDMLHLWCSGFCNSMPCLLCAIGLLSNHSEAIEGFDVAKVKLRNLCCAGEGVAGNQCRSLLRALSLSRQPHATCYKGSWSSSTIHYLKRSGSIYHSK